MKKLYYVKCDDFICDVTDRYDHAQQLIKEYQKDDGVSKYKLQYSAVVLRLLLHGLIKIE